MEVPVTCMRLRPGPKRVFPMKRKNENNVDVDSDPQPSVAESSNKSTRSREESERMPELRLPKGIEKKRHLPLAGAAEADKSKGRPSKTVSPKSEDDLARLTSLESPKSDRLKFVPAKIQRKRRLAIDEDVRDSSHDSDNENN